MPKCSAKCGLFVPRPCPQVANNLCSRCNKPACPEHYEVIDHQVICINCRSEAANPSAKPGESPADEFDLNYWRTHIKQNRATSPHGGPTIPMALDITFETEDFLSFDDSGDSSSGFPDSDSYERVES